MSLCVFGGEGCLVRNIEDSFGGRAQAEREAPEAGSGQPRLVSVVDRHRDPDTFGRVVFLGPPNDGFPSVFPFKPPQNMHPQRKTHPFGF